MIEIRTPYGNIPYKIIHYPDHTQKIDFERVFTEFPDPDKAYIAWKGYPGDEELVTLIYLTKHLQNVWGVNPGLQMDYIPNARMDRVKNNCEVFTLKYFCDIINSLGFKYVEVLDPHSNVAPALLDRVRVVDASNYITQAIRHIRVVKGEKDLFLYFPDEGALKRYGDMFPDYQHLVGRKVRDWATGEIKGLGIDCHCQIPEHAAVLMIDDIISYGGTLAYSADKLKELGFEHIYAYASHVENSLLDKEKSTLWKRLEDGIVDMVFTTDSLLTESNYLVNVTRL